MGAVNIDTEDELTRRLIDEGARLLVESGPAGLSLRKLAVAAGTSTMAVYTRFGDKQRLLAAMHREGFRRLGAALATAAGDEPLDALAAVGLAYRQAALQSRHLYDLMFGRSAAEFRPDAEGSAAARATYDPLVHGVRACVDAGILVGDPERIALHLWAVAHGMVSLELTAQLPVAPEVAEQAYREALGYAAAPFLPGRPDG